jgi:DNA processing protein
VRDLKSLCPQLLIVSGLAYGVDINAHRAALENGYETVGVLAHGLDQIYPHRHRETAVKMISQGGLLTEFFTQTNADKVNFVRRNRIVAGMSDACILVESAARGGGLITARLSRDYNRDVFAFPGKVGDEYSKGCNNLIRNNGAALITSAQDFVEAMGWITDAQLNEARQKGIERQLFPSLSPEEMQIVGALQKQNDQQINMLSVTSNLPVARLTAILFELELKGVVKVLAGGTYHLLGN